MANMQTGQNSVLIVFRLKDKMAAVGLAKSSLTTPYSSRTCTGKGICGLGILFVEFEKK